MNNYVFNDLLHKYQYDDFKCESYTYQVFLFFSLILEINILVGYILYIDKKLVSLSNVCNRLKFTISKK